ncbi:MAG: hypothetical protein ACL93V_09825 [Candidatus Electrothrix sp. YB6]
MYIMPNVAQTGRKGKQRRACPAEHILEKDYVEFAVDHEQRTTLQGGMGKM